MFWESRTSSDGSWDSVLRSSLSPKDASALTAECKIKHGGCFTEDYYYYFFEIYF